MLPDPLEAIFNGQIMTLSMHFLPSVLKYIALEVHHHIRVLHKSGICQHGDHIFTIRYIIVLLSLTAFCPWPVRG